MEKARSTWISSLEMLLSQFYNQKLNFEFFNEQKQMDKNQCKKVYVYPLNRLSLEPLSFNIPFPHQYSPPSSLEELMKHRPPLVQTERQENSSSVKTLSGLKQILSRSLFHKKQPKTTLSKQKLRDELTYIKADIKPISPESQEKEPLKTQKILRPCQPQIFSDIDNEGRFSNTDEILDTKFNKILDFQGLEKDLEIESKFTSKKSQKSSKYEQDVQLLEPCVTFESILQHEKLLVEENGFIREQLLIFTDIIEGQRSKTTQYKHKAKFLKKENVVLKEQNKLIQAQLMQKQEQFYNISVQNQEYKMQIHDLVQGKEELGEKFDQLTKDFEEICFRLQNYESIKDKEIENIIEDKNRERQQFCQEIMEKQKEIQELTNLVEVLSNKLASFDCSPKSVKNQRSKQSIQQDNHDQQEQDEFQENKIKTSSICLSLAEAESLKNIIEAKEQMFQKQLETLRTKSITEERSNSKIIENLTIRIQQYEEQLSSRTQKKEDNNIDQMKNTYTKRINALQLYLQEERQENTRLQERLAIIQQKYNTIDKDQDDELEDLLENCVNELEKQRNSNYLLRQEIHRLKQTFTKELYYVKDIEHNVFIN